MNGPEAKLADVLDEVRTLSLLGGRRIVVVDDADSFITANREILERYCTNPSPDGTLMLLCQTMPKSTRLYKIIAKQGSVIACEPPKGRAVFGWIVTRAQQNYQCRMSSQAAQRLREHIGDDVGRLDSEIAKLSAYVGDRNTIAPADIAALTGLHREEKVFAVTDAISSGDVATALGQWEQVLATDRAAPARAIAGLAWGIRRLLQVRREWEAGASLFALSKKMFTDTSVLEKRLKRLSTAQLEEQLQDLLVADLAIKTGMSTIETAIEKFIVKHSLTDASAGPGNRGYAA
jgi:DNA polymerase-3 subunit delta